MVSDEDAAFRILEIAAILFPLLFLVIQVFGRQFLSERDTPPAGISEVIQLIVVASIVLLVAIAGAVTALLDQPYGWQIVLGLISLYLVFLILGATAGVMGVSLWEKIEGTSNGQADLTQQQPHGESIDGEVNESE